MKKKVALLLAFVMVLSLMPMNVFGQVVGRLPVTSNEDGIGDIQTVVVRVPLQRVATSMLANPATNSFDGHLVFELDTVLGNRTDYATFGWSGGWGGDGIWTPPGQIPPGQTAPLAPVDSVHANWRGRNVPGIGITSGTAVNFTVGGFNPQVQLDSMYELVPINAVHAGNEAAIRANHQAHGISTPIHFAPAGAYWPNPVRAHRILVPFNFSPPGGLDGAANAGIWGLEGYADVRVPVLVTRAASATQMRSGFIGLDGNRHWFTGFEDIVEGGRRLPGVVFSVDGDALAFESGLIMPSIIIEERLPGSMAFQIGAGENVDRTIRLIAPYDYSWNVNVPGHLLHGLTQRITLTPQNIVYAGAPIEGIVTSWGLVRNTAPAQFEVGGGGPPGGTVASWDDAATRVNNRINTVNALQSDHRMYIEVTFPGSGQGTGANSLTARRNRGGVPSGLRGILALDGLALIPSPNAATHGNVNIDASWGPARENDMIIAGGGGGAILETAAAVMHTAPSRWWRNNWVTTNLTVGVRSDVALELGIAGAAPTIVSGIMGWTYRNHPIPSPVLSRWTEELWRQTRPALIQGGDPINWSGAGTPAEIRTARIQVRELVAGAFDTGFLNSNVSFHVPEGAQIMHAAWSLHNGDNRYTAGEINWQALPSIGNMHLWHTHEWLGWHTGQIAQNPHWQGVPRMTESGIYLFVPRNINPPQLRTLELYLWVSVEAGFEHKYGNELVVTVDGPAVARLEDDREVTVAYIEDPITLELDGNMIEVESGRTHNLMERTRIGDVIISESSHGRLRTGDEIWIYVTGQHLHRTHNPLRLHTAPRAEVESGDLILGPVNTLQETLPGGKEVTGVRIRVYRGSSSGNESVIRLTDNYLFGEILPGNEYVLVVSGPRLAANEFQIAARAHVPNVAPITIPVLVTNPARGEWTRGPVVCANSLNSVAGVPGNLLALGGGERLDVVRAFFTANGTLLPGFNATGNDPPWAFDWIHGDAGNPTQFNLIGVAPGAVLWTNAAGNVRMIATTINVDGVAGGRAFFYTMNETEFVQEYRTISVGQAQVGGVDRQTLGAFDSLPYAVQVIEWVGFDADVDPPARGPVGFARRSFTRDTIINVDGHYVAAIVFSRVGTPPNDARVTKMSGRVFADFVEGTTSWDAATNTATFTGFDLHGEYVTVELTTGNPVAVVNGVSIDIAIGAGQPQFAGAIVPVIYDGRQYVPARFLANQFGVPITSSGGGETMTIILG